MSSSIQVQPISTIPIWGAQTQDKDLLLEYSLVSIIRPGLIIYNLSDIAFVLVL